MKFDYNIEVENILNNIYEYMACEVANKNNFEVIDDNNIEGYINLLKNTKVYLGSDMHEFILNKIPKDKEGYYFRCAIAQHKNYLYPRLYNYLDNPIIDRNYNKFAIQMWESHMENFLIADIESKFDPNYFMKLNDEQLNLVVNKIAKSINEILEGKKIVIEFDDNKDLLNKIKEMIIQTNDLSLAIELIDMDKLREEMVKFSATFHIYDEYDKLEGELEYCLDNFFRYDGEQLLDVLVNKSKFELINDKSLLMKI